MVYYQQVSYYTVSVALLLSNRQLLAIKWTCSIQLRRATCTRWIEPTTPTHTNKMTSSPMRHRHMSFGPGISRVDRHLKATYGPAITSFRYWD